MRNCLAVSIAVDATMAGVPMTTPPFRSNFGADEQRTSFLDELYGTGRRFTTPEWALDLAEDSPANSRFILSIANGTLTSGYAWNFNDAHTCNLIKDQDGNLMLIDAQYFDDIVAGEDVLDLSYYGMPDYFDANLRDPITDYVRGNWDTPVCWIWRTDAPFGR